MRRLGEVSLRLAQRAAVLAETRRGVGIVFGVALAVWWLQALVIPLGPGRDLGTYLGAYVQLFQSHPIDLGYVLDRTPGASLVVGGLLDVAGGAFAEPAMSLLYAASVTAWFLAARTFSRRAALLIAVVLVAWPSYGILFHELSSDAVFAAAFAGWSLLVVRVFLSPTPRRFAFVGAGVGALALVRPGNQVLVVLALLPFLLRLAWRTRLLSVICFIVPAVALLGGWAIQNGIRYGDYTVARGGDATVPFYRTFVTDKIVRPSNGPASRELARAVQRYLIPAEPYRSYGISLDDFFTEASPRMQVDLLALSDRLKGWHSDHSWLRDVGIEAIRAHPGAYARGVTRTIWQLLRQPVYRDLPSSGTSGSTGNGGQSRGGATVVINGRTLPKPTEGEPIPAPREGGVTTPDQSIYTVWTSPSEHHLVFVHPGAEQRYVALHRRMDDLAANLPRPSGNAALALRLNQASHWYPPPFLWLAIGVVALLVRYPSRMLAYATPTVAAILVVIASALGLPAEPHYSAPVEPAFLVLAAGALCARRREPALAGSSVFHRLRLLAVGALGVVAAAWAAKIYVTKVNDRLSIGEAPHDLDVFLRAAANVVHGVSPYSFHLDQTYAYPPLLAFLFVPLQQLGLDAATVVWTLLSLAMIALALRLLGVRDWRCYCITLLYPITRSAVGLGTVGPLLLLAVAAAWRWRDSALKPAAAVGAVVALKLFLWPLGVWLALTRRVRPAGAAAGFALALLLVPWAGLGFAGLSGYPGLLHRLAHGEAGASYSVYAIGLRLKLPGTVATALSVLVALALLAAAAAVARDRRWTPRRRDISTLTLVLAASLAASPIVWIHYFLLLLVPLALTRPRLTPLWFVPFAYYPLGEAAWPGGDARKLGIALAVTCVLLLAGVLPGAGDPDPEAERAPSFPGPLERLRTQTGTAAPEEPRELEPRPR